MSRRIGLIGVPSNAGAHWPGQEKVPRVTREAGLVEGLQAAGLDVIAFVDLPVADVPQINAGLTLREALACLEVFASSRRFAGLAVSEFNPDNADEEGEAAMALVQGLVDAVTGRISRSLGRATSRRRLPGGSRRTDRERARFTRWTGRIGASSW